MQFSNSDCGWTKDIADCKCILVVYKSTNINLMMLYDHFIEWQGCAEFSLYFFLFYSYNNEMNRTFSLINESSM